MFFLKKGPAAATVERPPAAPVRHPHTLAAAFHPSSTRTATQRPNV
jgi:hypothetical protein